MKKLLICASSDTILEKIKALFTGGNFDVFTEKSGEKARVKLMSEDFELVIIHAPLCDEDGIELCKTLSENSPAGIMLMCKAEYASLVELKTGEFGIFVLPLPVNKPLFDQAVKLLISTNERLKVLNKTNLKLQSKLEELKMLDRAKCALIQYLNMTEKDAHRFIEKQAMDRRVEKREIIENILKTYEM